MAPDREALAEMPDDTPSSPSPVTAPGPGVLSAVWCATGHERYIREARISAASVRRTNPGIERMLFTDLPMDADVSDFDVVVRLENPQHNFADKINVIRRVDRDRFVFLDGDTYTIGNIASIWAVLERFDIAAAHDISRSQLDLPRLPDCFPELNTGVIGFNRRRAGSRYDHESFCEAWLKRFEAMTAEHGRLETQDQPAFRELVFASEARLAVLPPEYNCMFDVGLSVVGEVAILHGRSNQLRYVARKINRGRMHPAWGRLRSRWFKGEGRGYGWLRRNTRVALRRIQTRPGPIEMRE